MNIQELINSETNVTLSVTTSDLQNFADYLISQSKKELEEIVKTDKSETFLTAKQAADILKVDNSTLFRWAKKGILSPFKVGGHPRYKMSDIKAFSEGNHF
jgi:excisionase family DNA binding protein